MASPADLPDRRDCVVRELLLRWARERPAHPFLEFADGETWSYADTLERVRRAAGGLASLGVVHGSHVACWLPNSRAAVLTWLATNFLGAVHVPLNTGYRGGILQHALAICGARVLVAHASLLPRLDDVDTGALTDGVVVGGPVRGTERLRWHDEAILAQAPGPDPVEPVEPWDLIYVILTSGTTGPSKAVQCTYVQAWVGAALGMDYYAADDRLLANLPLFHVSGAGAVLDRLAKGGTCVLVDGFHPDTFWDVVRRHRVTGACLVGAMTQFLLRRAPDPRDRDHTLRHVVTVPWNQDSMALAQRYGLQMHTAFNMTETAVPIRSPANPTQLGTCGQPRPGIEARVVDAHDQELPPGSVGELVLRAARPWEISPGYLGDPAATAAVWRNGWFHTGDAFRRDADGNFYFVDRVKDAIRRRGENVSSFEVEAEALQYPAVLDAAAVAVPADAGEDEVLLAVVWRPGSTPSPRDLLAFLAPRMAHFMLPRYVRVLDELPRTPTAKVEKHRLRAAGVTPDTWDREAHGVTVRGGQVLGLGG